MRRHSRSNNVPNVMKRNEKKLRSPKKPKKEKCYVIKEYLMDYTANSNLHGLRYIGEKERTPVEKIFWLIIFICCVVLSAVLIRKLWIKWNDSPVIVIFAENTTPVWQIPFPAVTVCLENKSMQTKFNFTEYYQTRIYNRTITTLNATREDRIFEDLTLVCNKYFVLANFRKFSDGKETVENIKSVSPKMTEVFLDCTWSEFIENCNFLFASVLTNEGLCHTFNMLAADELFRVENLHKDYQYLEKGLSRPGNLTKFWSMEDAYPPEAPIRTYPYRVSGYGAKSGLGLTMQTKLIDMDYFCRGFQGFKILLHNPAELPRMSRKYFRSPLSQEVTFAVKPRMVTTSDSLKPYSPERRHCYFPSERYLKYFKIYTQSNCEMECLTNFTYVRCDCVHFSMPHGPDMKVCNTGSMVCMKNAQLELAVVNLMERDIKLKNANDSLGRARQVASYCKCMPACISIEYEAETSQTDYDWKAIYRAYNFPIADGEKDVSLASVLIFFKEPQFITPRRAELYGQTDFLANCGGLLGLFMGFSILSVAEIVYFLTLRLVCVIWRQRNNKRLENKTSSDVRRP